MYRPSERMKIGKKQRKTIYTERGKEAMNRLKRDLSIPVQVFIVIIRWRKELKVPFSQHSPPCLKNPVH